MDSIEKGNYKVFINKKFKYTSNVADYFMTLEDEKTRNRESFIYIGNNVWKGIDNDLYKFIKKNNLGNYIFKDKFKNIIVFKKIK